MVSLELKLLPDPLSIPCQAIEAAGVQSIHKISNILGGESPGVRAVRALGLGRGMALEDPKVGGLSPMKIPAEPTSSRNGYSLGIRGPVGMQGQVCSCKKIGSP